MLCAAVAHNARMNKPADKDGKFTVRAHLAGLVRMGRRSPRILEEPDTPPEMDYLLSWYLELSRARTFGQFGPNPVTYHDIDAWARLTNRSLTPEEVNALLTLDGYALHPPEDDIDG